MDKVIDKKKLIEYCNDIKKSVDVASMIKNDNSRGRGVGTNQFRELAAVCRNCDTFEEVELLIRYKIAKDDKGESWRFQVDGKTLGKAVLDAINKIRKDYDDDMVLKALNLFFGYLYQSARVWNSEVQPNNQKTTKKTGNGGRR